MFVHNYTPKQEPAKRKIREFNSYASYRKWQDSKHKKGRKSVAD